MVSSEDRKREQDPTNANWSALPGHQDRQNQGKERPHAGEAAPAIGEAAHAAEVAQATGEAVERVGPTQGIDVPTTKDPLHVDTSLLYTPPTQRGMLAGYAGPQPYQTNWLATDVWMRPPGRKSWIL